MPALVRQGPFSYDSNTYSSTRTYNLVKAAFVADKGDILEVIINGVKIIGEGANVSSDEFTVNSLTNPTSITVVATFTTTDPATSAALVFGSGTIIVKRLSNRSTAVVDFAPGSVIREVDLDSSTNQTLHVAQEAIDIAFNAMVLQANDKFDGRSKVIEDVADGVADNDAVNIGQLETHDTTITGYRDTTLAYRNTTNDYKLEAKDWAQRITSQVKVYTDGVVSGSFIEDSAKNWASGITSAAPSGGSAKEWSIGGEGTMATTPDGSEFSAKEYSQGVTATGGTSKEWAQKDDGEVISGVHSSKAHASVVGSNAPTTGSAKEWATTTGAAVDTTYSSKEYAQGSVLAAGGSAKNWSQLATTPTTTATDASSKEWATGTSTHKNEGSAKDWATYTAGDVRGASSGSMSSKEWAVGTQGRTVAGEGSAKDWATRTTATVDDSGYSAKEHSEGVTVSTGSAKQWSLGGGSFVEATAITGSSYSSKKYSTDSAASALAARSSAAAIANSFDSFDDKYLGRMSDLQASVTATTTGTWLDGSSTVTVASNTGIAVGQLFVSAGGTGVPTGANVLSISGTAIVLSDVFTGADTTEACSFIGYGVYGTFSTTASGGTDGPSTDNDNGALAAGMLYFNTTDNEMRICDGTNWIAASAAGTASLQEYKFVTTSAQVSSRTYSGTADVGGSFSYTQSNIIVFMNGVQLRDTTDYAATNGTSIVLVVAAVLNDEINIIAFKSFSVTNVEGTTVKSTGETGTSKFLRIDGDGTSSWQTVTPATDFVSAASGGTFSGDVTHNGNVIMATNKKIKQKGAFMQSSTHQALTLGG